jgi:hypothetical protein
MSDNTEKSLTGKNKYQKPELKVIELAADEVLVTGCKTYGGANAVGDLDCGIANNCAAPGS